MVWRLKASDQNLCLFHPAVSLLNSWTGSFLGGHARREINFEAPCGTWRVGCRSHWRRPARHTSPGLRGARSFDLYAITWVHDSICSYLALVKEGKIVEKNITPNRSVHSPLDTSHTHFLTWILVVSFHRILRFWVYGISFQRKLTPPNLTLAATSCKVHDRKTIAPVLETDPDEDDSEPRVNEQSRSSWGLVMRKMNTFWC